ncbi:hypothetical protein HBH70_128810 [Parastagonospora nodorum]|nr:hypothetical protein HBH52_008320 [Parastagonospora nodorum]KAH4025370.1 hypothetical protein HBI09_152610 [Parastagonospora nodorum]KAH4406464.1 hypothetical protein HBH92_168350 [Parastagonospora nodorum]KAH4431268.1 hypothetical protein HBH93_148100 [Parastagonospora nodorum]KAH4462267.1 hypothetical protein HBH91_059720 [Parastagonospora nodorum]
MNNGQSGTPCPSHETQNARSRSLHPPSSQAPSTTTSAAASQQVSPTKAAPAARTFFDPWNSSSTGHQRAENRLSGSTSWRASRNLKLSEQYKGGLRGGGKRVADTVGAGSKLFGKDGRKENGGWEKGVRGLRTGGQQSLAEVWGVSKTGMKASLAKDRDLDIDRADVVAMSDSDQPSANAEDERDSDIALQSDSATPAAKQIFAGLCFYINGSTAPLVSDHKLKHILAAHGARHSIALGRRSVTHVILGTANLRGGAGGGLAATKIQKEIAQSRGKAVKFITAEWVLESIKANRRLPESRFSPLKLAPQNQNSVSGMLRAGTQGPG